MNRFAQLLEKFQDHAETPEEADELAAILGQDDDRAQELYETLMLEVDLYESYSGIAKIQAGPRRRKSTPGLLALAWAVAAAFLIALLALMFTGSTKPGPVPIPPLPPAAPHDPKSAEPAPAPEGKKAPDAAPAPEHRKMYRDREEEPEHEEREHRSKRAEVEREYQKGLREVERKRAQGKDKEAEEKLREIQRERDKKLKGGDRREDD